jgi:hypothetical protein
MLRMTPANTIELKVTHYGAVRFLGRCHRFAEDSSPVPVVLEHVVHDDAVGLCLHLICASPRLMTFPACIVLNVREAGFP